MMQSSPTSIGNTGALLLEHQALQDTYTPNSAGLIIGSISRTDTGHSGNNQAAISSYSKRQKLSTSSSSFSSSSSSIIISWSDDLPSDLWLSICKFLPQQDFVYLPDVCKSWFKLAWQHSRWGFDFGWIQSLYDSDEKDVEAVEDHPCDLKGHPYCDVHFPTRRCCSCGRFCPRLNSIDSCPNRMCQAFLSHYEVVCNEVQGNVKKQHRLFHNHSWSHLKYTQAYIKRTSGNYHKALLEPDLGISIEAQAFELSGLRASYAQMFIDARWYHPPITKKFDPDDKETWPKAYRHGDDNTTIDYNPEADLNHWGTRPASLHESLEYTLSKGEEWLPDVSFQRPSQLPSLAITSSSASAIGADTTTVSTVSDDLSATTKELVIRYDPYSFRPDFKFTDIAARLSRLPHFKVIFEMQPHNKADCNGCMM